MRIQNSIKNMYMSMLTQIVMIGLSFLSRKVFLDSLGSEYLGINGLLTSLLSMLGLVEGGIGVSIVYNLYKPLAEKDIPKITALVKLYKKLYTVLAIIIFGLSSIMYIFLDNFIKGSTNIEHIGIIYYVFVFQNIVSYLNAHKWSLINADQKEYIIAKYNLVFNIIKTIIKIIILLITKNYVLFLIIEAVVIIIQNVYNGRIVNERYPYIKSKEKYNIDKETKENIIKNVKAIFLHNIGSYCVFGTDNLLISSLVGIKSVGLYSNYTMIITQLTNILMILLNGIGSSVGNLIATENEDKRYHIFNVVNMINFWMYSLSTIVLYNLLEPFIDWWLGKGLLLDKLTFIIILINFYITGMRKPILIFKAKAGIFDNDKYIPLIEAIINIGASLILVKYFGLAGIFIGTTISSICIPVWTQSKIVYNEVFNKSVYEYFKKYISYIVLTLIVGSITTYICNMVVIGTGLIGLIIKGIISVVIISLIYICIFYKSDEFKYISSIINLMLNKVRNKYQGAN